MELIKCKVCGNMVSSEVETCPSCGSSVRLSVQQISLGLTEAVQKYDELSEFHEGMAMVRKGGLCGFINQTGEEVIPCTYDFAFFFSEGLAVVKIAGKWGYVDRKGNSTFGYKEVKL